MISWRSREKKKRKKGVKGGKPFRERKKKGGGERDWTKGGEKKGKVRVL